MFVLITCLYALTIGIVNTESIPKKFVSNIASKSLLCHSCAVIAEVLNRTLFEDNKAFDTNIGFRLDSSGKKIRKNSQWFRIHITLDDIHCEWKKELFKVAKRKSGLLYLTTKENIKRNEKLNQQNKQKALSENRPFYIEMKQKLLKKDSKYNKMMDDMCILMTELFDEWLHSKQTTLRNIAEDELKKTLNIKQFCLDHLEYKSKPICTDDMLKYKMDLSSTKKVLRQRNDDHTAYITSKQWHFILDLVIAYGVILIALSLFSVLHAPVFICKWSLIPLLLCPQYIYKRNPSFGNLSTWVFVWYWYFIRLWEIFNNGQFFRNKSFIFCWFHCAMKNMFKASVKPPSINIEAFTVMLLNIVFMVHVFPYIFGELLAKTEINNICEAFVYPDIVLKIMEIVSFVASILYCVDNGAIFVLNAVGYDIEHDMKSPWKSYSILDFWGKRWNQFVAYSVKTMIYKPVMRFTESRNVSLMIVFIGLGIIHVVPMYLDGFEYDTLIVVLVWFLIQPFCLFVEYKTIKTISFGSDGMNQTIHCLLTFGILFGSFLLSLKSTCFIKKQMHG